ncbi:MAG: cation:proton antiporter [Weeksellaceae bacterium]
MDQHALITLLLFISFFLILTGGILKLTQRISMLPYTVALLLVGALAQFIVHTFHIPVHLELTADIIYFVLLPLLLFESAFHINFHQFRIQFKTITFIATFGILVSIFTIGYFLSGVIGYPLGVALLFGAIISSTDPIAVISLFKTLGAPKRLGLVADGESMFNDATGVILTRVVASFVVTGAAFQANSIYGSVGNFLYVFLGSMVFGLIAGYLFSKIIERIQNDRVIETTITVAAAIGSFVAAEHFFHFSGVISTVVTGIVMGNLGKTKFSVGVRGFVEEFWEYFAFISVSLVFFFATFNLDFSIFSENIYPIIIAILAVLVGRAVSVYLSFFITNRVPFFKDEPNVPLSWQHIMNWGGLRGVIPLVLVYSLPDEFAYKNDMLAFTLGAFLFTLIINGLTIRTLLLKLGLHLPKKEEEIMHEEMSIIEIADAKESLAELKDQEFDQDILVEMKRELDQEEKHIREHLNKVSSTEEFQKSLKIQTLNIERHALEDLYNQGYITENVYFDFDTELDLQQDALEYPEMNESAGIDETGKRSTHGSFRKRIVMLRKLAGQFPILKNFIKSSRESLIEERIGLLKVRIMTSTMVIEYLEKLDKLLKNTADNARHITKLVKEQKALINENKDELTKLTKEHPRLIQSYQKKLAYNLITQNHDSHGH